MNRKTGLTAGLVMVIAFVGACGSSDKSATSSSDKSATSSSSEATLSGTFSLKMINLDEAQTSTGDGAACNGTADYPDLVEGALVTVRDSKGATVNRAALSAGTVKVVGGFGGKLNVGNCDFPFIVAIPASAKFLTVQIANRPEVTLTDSQISSLTADISITNDILSGG